MYKKYFKLLVLITILSGCVLPVAVARERSRVRSPRDHGEKNRQDQQAVTQAVKDIDEKLKPVLEHVNQEDSVGPGDISVLNDTLKINTRYVMKMEQENKSKFFILSAWTHYFSGSMQAALKDSIKAFKSAPAMQDAEATLLTMALANQNYSALKPVKMYRRKLLQQQRRKSLKTGRKRNEGLYDQSSYSADENAGSREAGILNLDIKTVNYDLLGKTFGAGKLKCLNGEVLDVGEEDKLYCFLIWKTDYTNETPEQRQKSDSKIFRQDNRSETENTSSDRQIEKTPEFEIFSKLCLEHGSKKKIVFAAVNTDQKKDREKILKYINVNSGPWAQIILSRQPNSPAAMLYQVNINRPALMMVKNNKILYVGSIESYLPRILVEQQLGPAEKNKTIKSPGDISNTDRSDAETGVNITEKPQIPRQRQNLTERKKEKTDAEKLQDSVAAGQLYELAKIHFKKGYVIGYKKCVDACREILQKYPDTREAVMAREMLRQIPARKRKLYHVTDEDMGFKKN